MTAMQTSPLSQIASLAKLSPSPQLPMYHVCMHGYLPLLSSCQRLKGQRHLASKDRAILLAFSLEASLNKIEMAKLLNLLFGMFPRFGISFCKHFD